MNASKIDDIRQLVNAAVGHADGSTVYFVRGSPTLFIEVRNHSPFSFDDIEAAVAKVEQRARALVELAVGRRDAEPWTVEVRSRPSPSAYRRRP